MASKEKKCTLSDEELIEKCIKWVSELCRTGGQAWCLKVPVDFNNDPDMLLGELIERFKKTLLINNKTKTRDNLISMLEDVVNELDLSDEIIQKHGALGTSPAELVRLVLDEKDKTIIMLKAGMIDIDTFK